MKKINVMKYFLLISFLGVFTLSALAQDEEEGKEKVRPARKAFESAVMLDQQTDVINTAKTLEWNIQHRFGTVQNGSKDLWGMFAASNIRLGFTFSVHDRASIGFGLSKVNVTNPFIDLNAKIKLLQQGRDGGSPFNVTYYGNMGINTEAETEYKYTAGVERLSYFHSLIISRRFSNKFSAQLVPQVAHFNAVDSLFENDIFGLSVGARLKVSSQSSLMFEFTAPFGEHPINSDEHGSLTKKVGPYNNISFGWEIATSSHAFQIVFGVYRGLVPQQNLLYNSNEFVKEVNDKNKLSFAIGFNMTRLWNL